MKYTHHKKIVNYYTITDLERDLRQLLALEKNLEDLSTYFNHRDLEHRNLLTTEDETAKVTFNNFYHSYQVTLVNLQKRLKLIKDSEAIKPVPIIK